MIVFPAAADKMEQMSMVRDIILFQCSFCTPQIPNVVTISVEGQRHLAPFELVGWFLRKCGIHFGHHVLIVTDDKAAVLGAHVLMRLSPAVNVTCCVTAWSKTPVCFPLPVAEVSSGVAESIVTAS